MVPNPESEKNTHTIQLKDTETLRSIGLGIVQNILEIDNDTLTSIPVPEQYFFWYQFYEINFNKIT